MNCFDLDQIDADEWCDLIDYSNLLDDVDHQGQCWDSPSQVQSARGASDRKDAAALSRVSEFQPQEYPRKRGLNDPCNGGRNKACREKMRREKLNDRFTELSAILEPGRPVKTDKLAILGDTIRVLNQLKSETQEYNDTNKKLLEEIKIFKAEKNELREEKLVLKADKELVEQQLKSMTVRPCGFIPAHPSVYQAVSDKVPMLPSYGFVPMWHYLSPSTCDTSQDQALRPPAA